MNKIFFLILLTFVIASCSSIRTPDDRSVQIMKELARRSVFRFVELKASLQTCKNKT